MIQLLMRDLPVPIWLILTEALHYRLIPGHPKHPEVEKDLAKIKAGYKGELTLRYYVKQLPHEKYYIFHDLQLELNGFHFQIDTLSISHNYILVIEAKNIKGTLIFDNVFNQLIRINQDGSEYVFEDPRVQASTLRTLLGRFLAKYGMNILPIDQLVFFSSIKTNLKTNSNDTNALKKVCKGRDLFNKIEALEKTFPQPRIDDNTLLKISNFLLSKHTPKKINILDKYGLTARDIISGVRCPHCLNIPMNYSRGKWHCSICQTTSKDAYIEAIKDHFLLIKQSITNAELRSFLHLPTNDTAQKILFRLHLPYEGNNRARLYFPSKL
ncbi:nuclease-related domain-containing protein [Neobacillus citreus]|uniref:NERD domain-containing protein n=1 Tax=Neobacillus citreus TaxID=2833578 RepID=A0A942T2D5_9BACI|nr:nuclease-related domain-containing protein [Neobacillus citreus]MCH6266547.1 NERD domain-containing protein [Neobacillus citreus]